jgi:hypothetical protein
MNRTGWRKFKSAHGSDAFFIRTSEIACVNVDNGKVTLYLKSGCAWGVNETPDEIQKMMRSDDDPAE